MESADNTILFPPIKSAGVLLTSTPDTAITITSVSDLNIKLGLTFYAASSPTADYILAGIQSVHTKVIIEFSNQLPLSWVASVLAAGEISPNQLAYPFSANADQFSMRFNNEITLTHDESGWRIPPYDNKEYRVCIGLGMGLEEIDWGCSVTVAPNSSVLLEASAYEVFRLDMAMPIGSPVTPTPPNVWQIPLGSKALLSFSASGIGTLTFGTGNQAQQANPEHDQHTARS